MFSYNLEGGKAVGVRAREVGEGNGVISCLNCTLG